MWSFFNLQDSPMTLLGFSVRILRTPLPAQGMLAYQSETDTLRVFFRKLFYFTVRILRTPLPAQGIGGVREAQTNAQRLVGGESRSPG